MRKLLPLVLVIVLVFLKNANAQYTEEDAVIFSQEMDNDYNIQCNNEMLARWDYITDVENVAAENAANEADIAYFQFQSEEATTVQLYDYDNFEDFVLYRKFRFQKDKGPGNLETDDLTEYQTLQSGMETLYSTATICDYTDRTKCDLVLEPDLEEIMATSTDYEELWYVWQQWREVAGTPILKDYLRFVELSNEAAQNDGYSDTGEYWLSGYTVTQKEVDGYDPDGSIGLKVITTDDFKAITDSVFNEVLEKLYKPLHAFVRMKLKETEFYGDYIDSQGTLPSHILGNMWAQQWTNIAAHVMPFPDQPDFDVTQSMIENDWDIDRMFEAAEDFFTSLGLPVMTDTFWEKSVINQTDWGKTIVCHGSAEDFCTGPGNEDFRIKMCTQVNMDDLVTVHHEMGHIQYFMAYTERSHVFRTSANAGFHEAIGDLISLSVSTPDHMEKILGLTAESVTPTKKNKNAFSNDEIDVETQQDLNFLMRMALEKIAFLPFGYLIDKYRWQIFDGTTTETDLNDAWWKLREEIQGVSPPMALRRGEEYTSANYFDAGAKYHVPANVPYIRYFVSFIVQFQFHQKLCEEAGIEGSLHKCDIYNSNEAGQLLLKSLQDGFSRPWPLVLNDLGGSLEMSADAIINYFDPLIVYINEVLAENEQTVGWMLPDEMDKNMEAQEVLTDMETTLTPYAQYSVQMSWNYFTNATDETASAMNAASANFSQMYKSIWETSISTFDYTYVTDPFLRRQFALQQSIGTAILEENDLNEFNTLVGSMTEKLNNKICPYLQPNCDLSANGLDIDALEILMGTTKDYDELHYYWMEWRDVSGKEMIGEFAEYIDITNKAAVLNGFNDGSEMWLNPYSEDFYSSETFKNDIEDIWNELEPFYVKLHAYVRFKLNTPEYGYDEHFDSADQLIPANILGNMYAQSWVNIYDIVAPFPEVPLTDLTPTLEANIDDVKEMFQMAEDFFTGIGLYAMSSDFVANTLYEQPTDGTIVVCHASAWDFYSIVNNVTDGMYRIKMCTNKNQEDFLTIHHEMGHIQYYMSYTKDMPLIYRDGANQGFHEAIGDTIALSVSTPAHIDKIADELNNEGASMVKPLADATEQDLNFLMKQALDKIAFMPFAYILDQWRWEVFEGKIAEIDYNYEWWRKRLIYQGVKPPMIRSSNEDFDIGCKYHVPTNVPYIRYFVATILQFQFHERLCDIMNYQGDIYNCDIDQNIAAGTALKDMLSKGRSQNWQKTLADFLGDPNGQMSATSILNYFEPLIAYLDQQITDNDIEIGWSDTVLDNYVISDLYLTPSLKEMDTNLSGPVQNAVQQTWNYYTDETDETLNTMNEAIESASSLYKAWWEEVIQPVRVDLISNADSKRQVEMQQSIGIAIFDESSLTEFNAIIGNMADTMNRKICPYENQQCDAETFIGAIGIDELEALMGTERDYDILKYYWEAWREVSGEEYVDIYPDYINSLNDAAHLNNFDSGKELWINKYTWESYETQDFLDDVERLWTELERFYQLLHAYTREKLKGYSDWGQYFDEDNLIPAHLLGNMYAQSWMGIYDIVVPYPEETETSITSILEDEIDDVTEMFDIAEEFFTSIGLYPMTKDFNDNSMYLQPEGKVVVCHASAMDFRSTETDNLIDGKFRIKMCTDKNEEDFITIHHEMGHIEYFMAYSDQGYPLIYRNGANPGFHEAIGDTIALSVSTPSHMQMIADNLTASSATPSRLRKRDAEDDDKKAINFLMKMALDKIAFLPYGYILDQWRWDAFKNNFSRTGYNIEWWRKRIEYQGVRPPLARRPDTNFDIGCKYHVAANVPYIRYFMATILQFQFHQKLCDITDQPVLHECDIYNMKNAGDALKAMLIKGASEPWQDQLQDFLGEMDNGEISSQGTLNYFAPLIDYLENYFVGQQELIGWDKSTVNKYVNTDEEANELMQNMDSNLTSYAVSATDAAWEFNTNINPDTEAAMNEASAEFSIAYKSWWIHSIQSYDYTTINDPYLRRQFEVQQSIGTSILEEDDLNAFNLHVSSMTNQLNNKVCPYDNPSGCSDEEKLDINALEILMGTERDFDVLNYYWQVWRRVSGINMISDFTSYVNLSNEAAMMNNFNDASEMWLDPYAEGEYTSENFRTNIQDIWTEIEPLYRNIHAYVRMKLKENDYSDYFNEDGLIPANILGNMYAQSWVNIYDIVAPYPEVPIPNITPVLENEVDNVKEMFDFAEDFFMSIGLYAMNEDFQNNTLYEQPDDRDVICHASAWDFYSTEDDNINDGRFRMKMCTNKNQEDFITIHHEMGHIEYFMAYSNQDHPIIFRTGANPGFHEAIGDTISLSVSTPSHLNEIGGDLVEAFKKNRLAKERALIPKAETDTSYNETINFLMKMALDKVAFLPFAYIIDEWRWSVFDGSIAPEDYNYEWWQRRLMYQGVSPPNGRSTLDFDIGCKFHVPSNVPYIRYFVAAILQFQFHERLCILDNQPDLNSCDIYDSKIAGDALLTMLSKGYSEPWQMQLDDFLDNTEGMSALSMLRYFEPLTAWLEEQDLGEVGWDDSLIDNYVSNGSPDQQLLDNLKDMDVNLTIPAQNAILQNWNYNTDETEENQDAMNEATKDFSLSYKAWWMEVIDPIEVTILYDAEAKRQVQLQKSIGVAIFNETSLTSFTTILNGMSETMNTKICPFDDMKCDPEKDSNAIGIDKLEALMGTERDYSTLLYYWSTWREETGDLYVEDYPNYIKSINDAARLNGFDSGKELWINKYTWDPYETQDFLDDLESLWSDLERFYSLLHAYTREKLKDYSDWGKYFEEDDLIPAHLLGNMYAQSWINVYDIVVPYPDQNETSITSVLEEEIDNVDEMFEISEDFFVSIGLYAMTPDFNDNTMYVQPEDKVVVCHASAMDFRSTEKNNTADGWFRIKMCTDKNEEDFITIHHEMGHIEYFMAYSDQGYPLIYRNGANPGFHEAIGDTIALSVSTPRHMQRVVDFLKENKTQSKISKRVDRTPLLRPQEAKTVSSDQKVINFLMKQALDKIAFLPYAYILDQWRWDAFKGNFSSAQYNYEWWRKRIDYQGLRPGIRRTHDTNFDIGCKYHVAANVPYIRYFVAHILQFQFHQKLCELAGQPILHDCDIYGNKDAGAALKAMLMKGASESWQDQLEEFLGEMDNGTMSSQGILNYFEPLINYLENYFENKTNLIGWSSSDEVLDDYFNNGSDISAIVPIIVGAVLAVLVIIVVVAFIIGQKKRKAAEKRAEATGKVNEAIEMDGKEDI